MSPSDPEGIALLLAVSCLAALLNDDGRNGHNDGPGHDDFHNAPFLNSLRAAGPQPGWAGPASYMVNYASGLRTSMRKRVVVAVNLPSRSMMACNSRSFSAYASTVKPGTIHMTLRRK